MRPLSVTALISVLSLTPGFGNAQTVLTLQQAIDMARTRNGNAAAAYANYLGSRAQTAVQRAAFFPTLTPSYSYQSIRNQVVPGPHGSFQQTEGNSWQASASWLVLDSGQRQYNYLSAKRSEDSQFNTARQTLRQVLFDVEQQFFNVQRANETLASAQTEFDNAKLIDDQTKFSAEVGKTAKKDTYQSQADLANARFTLLQARNTTLTAGATLKSTIGFAAANQLPPLQSFDLPDTANRPTSLAAVLDQGMKNRPDLIAQRKNVDSLNFTARVEEINAGVSLTLNTSFSETYSPDRYEDRSAVLTLSYPLFDGGLTRARARAAKLAVTSARYTLLQLERNAKAEIETAFVNLAQIAEQIEAAKEAVRAANQNFEAASAAYKEGAESVIDVSTARVSLATAQANLINAKYDYYIAEIQLKLATGEMMPGEPAPNDLGRGFSAKVTP
jgi:outer membrane protein